MVSWPPPIPERRRRLVTALALILAATSFLHAAPAHPDGAGARPTAAERQAYLHGLQARADELQLHRDPYWRTLLHFRRGWFDDRSLIDDPDFFLAPKGKVDARAELHATLAAILHPLPPPPADPEADVPEPPGCRFPARQHWLAARLEIPPERLAVPECPPLAEFLRRTQPRSVTLAFPSAYLNNPASLFGHTLLSLQSQYESRLLNHAVNYAAVTTESNGVVFACKGIFGFYPGRYGVMPYYIKLQEYNDISQRDVWEYRLNFTEEEIHQLVRHIWELREIHADYYFFDENCSFALLYLLEAARPGLHLVSDVRPWVIPLDTVRLVERAGLVTEAGYSPSKAVKIRHLAGLLPDAAVDLAVAIGESVADPALVAELPYRPLDRARILDLATEYTQARYTRGELNEATYSAQFLTILRARSTLADVPAGASDYDIPEPVRPDHGHASSRLTLAAGRDAGNDYLGLQLRPAYHSLDDPDAGYQFGSQIEFADTQLRYDFDRDELELNRLDLISIRSLSPRDRFQHPKSWLIDAGYQRQELGPGDRAGFAYLYTGGGGAWRVTAGGLAYAVVTAEIRAGEMADDYAVAPGIGAGLLQRFGDWGKLQLFGHAASFRWGDRHEELSGGLSQTVRLSPRSALGLRFARRRTRQWYESETALELRWTF